MAAPMKRKQAATSASVSNNVEAMSEDFSSPSRVLWQFIGGAGVLQPQHVVEVELKKCEERLIKGLNNYSKQATPSGERLKSEKKVSDLQFKFVQSLAKFLGLDEVLCYDVYCHFLIYEYRSSKKNLQAVLSNARQTPALMLQVRDFYFSERLYMLRCLMHVLSHWSANSHHQYKDVYARFVEEAIKDERLIDSLFSQYENVCTQALPTWETHGSLMTQKQAYVWARHNLKEQCQILELILLYYKDFQASPTKFIDLLERFKKQGFGKHQVYKHLLDGTCNNLLDRISYLHLLIILQCLDFELLNILRSTDSSTTPDHPILNKQIFQKLDRLFTTPTSSPIQAILWLSWASVRHIYHQSTSDLLTRKLGHQALQANCFRTLVDLLECEPFNGQSAVASVAHYLVYVLLYSVMSIFHEDSLGHTADVYTCVQLVLSQEFVANHLWANGLTDGLGVLVQGSLDKFPLQFSPFVRLCAVLSAASAQTARKVMSVLRKIPTYTELFDNNSSHDIISTGDSTVWLLAKSKHPYPSSETFYIKSGSKGQLYPQEKGGAVIQWECDYNGWLLLHAEMTHLLVHTTSGADRVSLEKIERTEDIVRLITNILKSDPTCVDSCTEICSVLYQLITRFSSSNSPPLQLLSLCLQTLNEIAKVKPQLVWDEMRRTELLPFMTENLDNMTEVLSGVGLHAGRYGAILMGHECSTATYPVTTSFLSVLSTLVKPLVTSGHMTQLLPCVLYILREVFPAFNKWRYNDPSQREIIGEKCLDLFHKIVDIRSPRLHKHRPDLRDVCVQSLLYSESGQSLLDIVATGVDVIEMTQSQQVRCDEGYSIKLINIIRLSFSVLNRLLLLKPPSLPVSPVEHALSSQPANQSYDHIIATIAHYIYHRYNPSLPTIAVVLLKRLAIIRPMAILACLGHDAESLRDAFIMRLRASSEDVNLKVSILEFLSVSVDTQPGLMELFLSIQYSHPTSNQTKPTIGKTSCIHTLLDLMAPSKQDTYLCPPPLLRACTQLIESLWLGGHDPFLNVIRHKPTFWTSVVTPLLKDLPSTTDIQMISNGLLTCAHVFYILAQEIYISRGKLDENLNAALIPIKSQHRLLYWSKYIVCVLESRVDLEDCEDDLQQPAVMILNSWKNLLITLSTHQVNDWSISDSDKQQLLADMLHACSSQFGGEPGRLNLRLASITSTLYFTLIKSWTRCDIDTTLTDIEKTLVETCTNSKTLVPTVQIGLIGSLSLIFDSLPKESIRALQPAKIHTLLAVVCPLLQHSTYQLPPPHTYTRTDTRTDMTTDTPTDTRTHTTTDTPTDTINVNQPGSKVNVDRSQKPEDNDIKLKLHVMCLCCLRHLIASCNEPADWLPVIQQYSIVQSLLVSLNDWIKAVRGIHYVNEACMLLQTMASTEQGASHVATCGIIEYTCLSLSNVYNTRHLTGHLSNLHKPKQHKESISWHKVYCNWLDLYSTLIGSLKYSFIKNGLDVVGVHQDRLNQALDKSHVLLHEATLREASSSCRLLFELSHFVKEWRFHLPDVLSKLLTSLLFMCQTYVSLLIRPRYLLHLLERQSDGGLCRPTLPSMLQSQTSTDDVEVSSIRLVSVQTQMLQVIAVSLSTLRSFSPNLCAILLDQSLDITEYDAFLQIGFSRPSLDEDIAHPSFGTFLDCITVCVRLLTKADGRTGSPTKSPLETTNHPPKQVIEFVLENCLYIVLTQACLHLTDASVHPRDKQLLKRELGAELNSFFMSYHRYLKRGGPPSPGGPSISPRSSSTPRHDKSLNRYLSFSAAQDPPFFKLVHEFVQKILR